MGGDNRVGGKGKGHQGTRIKDTWTKPRRGVGPRVGGEDVWGRVGKVGEEMERTVLKQQ